MKVLSCTTTSPTIRSEIIGWTLEDISNYVPNKMIGHTPGCHDYLPETIFEALHLGYKLLGPPQFCKVLEEEWYDWWLVKE